MNSKQAAAMYGVSERTINYYCDQGYVRPAGRGSGRAGLMFPAPEVRVMDLMFRLTDAGLKTATAARVAREVVTGVYPLDGRTVRVSLGERRAVVLEIPGV